MKVGEKKKQTNIPSITKVNGELKATNATFKKEVEVNGRADCFDCTFEKDVLVCGDGTFTHCNFEQSLEILSKKAVLLGCRAKEVFVTNPIQATSFYKQKIRVEKGSKIDRIVFSEPGGIVYKSTNSVVTEVENGTIKK